MAKPEQQDAARARQEAHLDGGCHGRRKKRVCTESTLSQPLIQLYLSTLCLEVEKVTLLVFSTFELRRNKKSKENNFPFM